MTAYVPYNNNVSVRELDSNTVKTDQVSEFPRGLYIGKPFAPSQYICESGPRDTLINFVRGRERWDIPNVPGHYSYSYWFNEYGVAAWPSKDMYHPEMRWRVKYQPDGCAPKKFYDPVYTSANAPVLSEAHINSVIARQGIGLKGQS